MSSNFDALIFDLGGVIYHIDTQKTFDAFGKLGIKHFDRLYSLQQQVSLFDKLETGAINPTEFAAEIKRICETNLSDKEVFNAWNALLIDIPEENIRLLQSLRNRFRIFLLSNTNEIHKTEIDRYMVENSSVKNLSSLFDKAYYSFIEGLRKPDTDFYRLPVNEHQLDLSKTIFIDDNEDNVAGAIKAGLNAAQMERNSSLEQMLHGLGIV